MQQRDSSPSQSYFWPTVLAVGLHVIIFGMLFVSFSMTPELPPSKPIVQATLYQLKSQSQATTQTNQKIAGEAKKTAAKQYEAEQMEQRKIEQQKQAAAKAAEQKKAEEARKAEAAKAAADKAAAAKKAEEAKKVEQQKQAEIAKKKAAEGGVMSDDERRKLVSTETSLSMSDEPRLPSSMAGLENFSLTRDEPKEAEPDLDADSFFNLPNTDDDEEDEDDDHRR